MSNHYENTEKALKLLPITSSEQTLTHLKSLFLPLDKLATGLAERSLDYLLTGEDNILADLQQRQEIFFQEIQEKESYRLHYDLTIIELDRNETRVFYANLCDALTTEQIVRLGKLLASVTIIRDFGVYDEIVPKWVICLMNATLNNARANFTFAKIRECLDIGAVADPEKVMVMIFLERKERSRDATLYFGGMNDLADVETFIDENSELIEAAIPRLSELEQREFLQFLAIHSKVVQNNPNILALLCVYSYEPSRREAINQLINVKPEKIQPFLKAQLLNQKTEDCFYAIEALFQTGQSSRPILESALAEEADEKVSEKITVALARLDFLATATDYVSDQAILTPLDKIIPDREISSIQVSKYILTGEGDEILNTLSKKNYLHADENVCAQIYEIIFSALNAEQIIRLGKVLAAIKVDIPLSYEEYHTPDYIKYLVVHALNMTTYPKINRDNWTYEILTQTFRVADANPEKHLANLLLCGYIRTTPLDSETFIQNNAPAIESVIPTLPTERQQDFLKKFLPQYPDFIKSHPKSIALLCTGKSKVIRELASAQITDIQPKNLQPHLQTILKTGNAKSRLYAIDALTVTGESCLPILEEALKAEKTQSIIKHLEQSIQRIGVLQAHQQAAYVIPEFKPLEYTQIPDSFIEVMKQNVHEIYEKNKEKLALLITENSSDYDIKRAKKICEDWEKIEEDSDEACKFMLNMLNGQSIGEYKGKGSGWMSHVLYIADYENSVQKLPEYGLFQAMLLSDLNYRYSWHKLEPFIIAEILEKLELRHFLQVLESLKEVVNREEGSDFKGDIASGYLCRDYYRRNSSIPFTAEKIVPFFMTYPELIAEALGILPMERGHCFEFENALKVLQIFPQIPEQYIAKLLEVALGAQKSNRFECQEVLTKVPNIHLQAIETLNNDKVDVRVTAAEWLGRLGQAQDNYRAAIVESLQNLMKKEKKEAVITATLSALEQNGDDISAFLTPEILLKDAQKGLKGKLSKTFTWFNFILFPTLQWQNGETVDRDIIEWWTILAEKIKDPKANELFQRYLCLLDENSQKTLSLHILQSFIAEDLATYSPEEAKTLADEITAHFMQYNYIHQNASCDIKNTWSKKYPEQPITKEIIHAEAYAQLQKMVKGSAIKSKGILALAHKATGSTTVELLQNYIKNNFRRAAQIGALLEAFSASDDPLIIQWILSISRRYRAKSIQQKAIDIITQTAKRNHWTTDELADRTIPMAGVDDSGVLTLDYDTRTLTAYIDEKYKFVLQNEDGKVIKTLPAPRKDDDSALIKEAKSLFSSCKKELSQMIEQQTIRLYEAMCCERVWQATDWQEYLLNHPIMKRLIARLVWLEAGKNGDIIQAFRPSEDGSLLNLDDDEITLGDNNQIKLAHKVLLDDPSVKAWQSHLKDYEIKPLFSQLDNIPPSYDTEATEMTDYRGYLTTTYKLRSLVTKLGYQRGEIGDDGGGGFKDYVKTYANLGLVAVVSFSGSNVPEEDVTAVLLAVTFKHKNDTSWRPKYIPLADIPPILLAETLAEYAKIAKGTSGFDPDWEKKSPY